MGKYPVCVVLDSSDLIQYLYGYFENHDEVR